ncbi:hypothetical protein Aph01nite_63660 [Acrocarpospora phusangensis]|uniref:Uncharacterized protein n=1 Tax=Acrocarpospora phusangensis TaxID=1070424 RepID=A0A919QHN6_9ACTN|nr:hypothetical protein [Acrocarpospora phusangensis]GIH28056.1 hypothetical protein Aph01nite_63660 [Acrocarpospora phusangensis]
MVSDAVTAERFMRAAMLGVAMAVEAQRILRVHMTAMEEAGGEGAVDIPFPDSTVMAAVLDAAATCFPEATGPPESARQAVLRPLLDLAALADAS